LVVEALITLPFLQSLHRSPKPVPRADLLILFPPSDERQEEEVEELLSMAYRRQCHFLQLKGHYRSLSLLEKGEFLCFAADYSLHFYSVTLLGSLMWW
jgi:hypothetical protein